MLARKFSGRLRVDSWGALDNVRSIVRKCLGDRSGATAIMIALAMTMLIGFAGLGTEVASWYVKKRMMQGAADAAASSMAASLAQNPSESTTLAQAEAFSVAAQNGFANGGTTTVTATPVTFNGGQAAQVSISQPQPLLLSALFMNSEPTIAAQSIAKIGSGGSGSSPGSGGDCLLVLSPSATNALTLNGNVSASLSCGVAVDSSSTQAMLMNGTNSVNASNINIVGNILKNPAGSNSTTPNPTVGASSVPDPYGAGAAHEVDAPTFSTSGCIHGATFNGTGGTLSPGVYCGNILINGSGITVTFNPGTYILDRSSLIINGSPNVSGSGVTIIFTTSTGSSVGTLTDNGTPVVNLTAPSSGTYAGFVFYQDRRASTSGSDVFNGAGASSIGGVMYFPNQALTYNGNPSSSSCTQIIAKTVTLNGTPGLKVTGCSDLGLATIGGSTSTTTASNPIVQ